MNRTIAMLAAGSLASVALALPSQAEPSRPSVAQKQKCAISASSDKCFMHQRPGRYEGRRYVGRKVGASVRHEGRRERDFWTQFMLDN